MLTKLSPATEAALPAIRNEWLSAGLSTAPADRSAAYDGVCAAYRFANLKEPTAVVWLDSPLAGCIGAFLMSGMGQGAQVGDQVVAQVWAQVRDQVGAQVEAQVWAQVRDQVWAQVVAQVWAQVRDQVGAQVEAQVWAQVRDQVWAQVEAQVWAQVRDQVWAQVGAQVWDQVMAQAYHAVYGAYEAGWLSYYATLSREGIAGCERLAGLMAVAKSAGWWWPFKNAVILTERPNLLSRDDRGRLHSPDGMAIRYPDGFGVYAWHGVRVPARVILDDPRTWTLDTILVEPNAEIRRVKMERFGSNRLKATATKRQADDYGTLYEFPVPGEDAPLVFVDVENSTPEPDGSFKRYTIFVPPDTPTAHAAVAWTFGMTPHDYLLSGQS